MKSCPTCGVALSASLVDAINNPSRDESCPSAKPTAKAPVVSLAYERVQMAQWMQVAAIFWEGGTDEH